MAPKNTKRNSTQALRVVNADTAGIDLGSLSHWVCCPPDEDGSVHVREFPTDTQSLEALADWLSSRGVTSVAMESTGVYWIPLFELLAGQGLDVVLVDTRNLSRVPGRKSDMEDCQWIQQLHACGLLKGAFRPGDDIVRFRALARLKRTLVREQADWLRRMQKELDQMNVRVHRAVSDISGVTGMAMLHAIVAGERDPAKLAALRDPRCHLGLEAIQRELTGTWRDEHLQNLAVGLKMYEFIAARIAEMDSLIMPLLDSFRARAQRQDEPAPEPANAGKAANLRKRGQEPLRQALYGMCGVDLTRIEGVSVETAQTVLSEVGPDLTRFETEKHFVSYLRFSPGTAFSGGKPVRKSRRRLLGCSRVREALRMSALAVRNSHTALGAYYRNIAFRKGANVAVFATARKIAQHIYRMLRYGTDYADAGLDAYEERCRERRIRNLKNNARTLGYAVTPCEAVASA
jgi:transposase